mmetsp:Transcript_11796/g.19179  ORF Transcript_11796/g.19179 Transcript_11796/m.19179 type:complete len:209 (-) Transcript_11796:1052-1678(-)
MNMSKDDDTVNGGSSSAADFYASLISRPANTTSHRKRKRPSQPEVVPSVLNGFYCDACKSTITAESEEEHASSIVHVFSQYKTATKPPRLYGLNGANKGYQMLRNAGWDEEHGLGLHQQGRLNPLETQFRTPDERQGIGLSKIFPSRVTHFESFHPTGDDAVDRQRLAELSGQREKPKANRAERRSRERRIKILEGARDEALRNAVYS